MKLLVQPDDGVAPLLKGIDAAKESIEILIFRFDQSEVERALLNAVNRGVRVRALIAYTNRGGEQNLRSLELRLLAEGVIVARTADDLVRYHGKMIIIDQRELYLLAFNFTNVNINRSRSFGIVTTDAELVEEAEKLFEADTLRQTYVAGNPNFIVSPVNARAELSAFIKAAKSELLIYDPNLSDPEMHRLLNERADAGVTIRLIGRAKRGSKISAHKLAQVPLHARVMVRDGTHVFMGSQSLRAAELDTRREIGIVFRDSHIAGALAKTFDQDWNLPELPAGEAAFEEPLPAEKIAKKVAKAVTKVLPPVAPVVEVVVNEVAGSGVEVELNPEKLQDTVKAAVKNAVKEAVREAFEDATQQELVKDT